MSRRTLTSIILLALFLALPLVAQAQGPPSVTFNMGEEGNADQVTLALKILFALTVLSVAPSILLMTTSFVRVVIVLSIVRQAMGVRNMPPNQVVVGLALFLTIFIMSPVLQTVNNQALQPYLNEEIGEERALQEAVQPMREFMFSQVREKDLKLMVRIADNDRPENLKDVSTMTLIPAFMISELKKAFQIGFMIFVPFLIIDMVTASILMTMGMLMLPPVIISLPFKVLLFVLVDGWHLVVGSLVQSFH
jgi:flagellar biosynthetic protein FliP